jgi:hypothetical protein
MFNLLLNCLLLFLQQHAGLSTSASYVSHMSYHEFDASYVVMRNKFGRVVALYVGPHHKWSKTCVWVSKCLVTNMKGPKQMWVPKNKASICFVGLLLRWKKLGAR